MAGVEIVPVTRKAEMKEFIRLPWVLYGGEPNWVPPIRADVAHLLDTDSHPFWAFSERELFLARRDDEIVGRIAAIVDRNFIDYQREAAGAWGFFECRNDLEAAAMLFAAAEKWLRGKGMALSRGPFNPSTNYEIGLLVEGFDRLPAFMMAYNPAYYPDLVTNCGYRKEKDLLSFRFTVDMQLPAWAISLAEKVGQESDLVIRSGDIKDLENELRLMNRIYRECWGRNWGFVPMTDDEIREATRGLMFILDPDFAIFAHYKGEPVGAALSVPDIVPLLKRFNGKVGLSGLVKRFAYWREVRGLRGLLLGVKEEYRQTGIPLAVLLHVKKLFAAKRKYAYIELGWNLEDNAAINQLYEDEGGLKPRTRYRVYCKKLAPRAVAT